MGETQPPVEHIDPDDAWETAPVVEAARKGDSEAFEALFSRYAERLRLFFLSRMSNALKTRLGAEDLLQETFLRGFRSLSRFRGRGRGAFLGWLFTIARNHLFDLEKHHRAGKHDVRKEVPGDALGEEDPLLERLAKRASTPVGQAHRADLQAWLAAAIGRVEEPYQSLLLLKLVMGVSGKETAAELGKSEAWVSGAYPKALAALRKEVGHDFSW